MRRLRLPALLLLAAALGLAVGYTALAQSTPTVLTVGQAPYLTIQSAVSAACLPTATGQWQILIPASATPADTVGTAQGCNRAYVTDQRQTPVLTCQWNPAGYLCTTGPVPASGSVSGVTIEHVFSGSGSFTYTHNLNSLYPLMNCYAASGTSAYTPTPVSASSVSVAVAGASDLFCSFLPGGPVSTPPVTPDFAFTLAPASLTYTPTLAAVQSIPLTLTQTVAAGAYSASTSYSLSGPSGFAASPVTITGGSGTGTMTATFPWNQGSAANVLAVTGTGGGQSHTQSSTVTIPATTLNTGLLEGWQLGEATGLTFADAQGTANIVAVAGAMTQGTVTGLPGTAPIFAGGSSNNYAQAANGTAISGITGTTPFSVSLWMTFTANNTYDMLLQTGASATTGFFILKNNGQLNFALCNTSCGGAGVASVSYGTITALNTLYHVVVTWNGSNTQQVYVNGALAGSAPSQAFTGTLAVSGLRLGADMGGNSPHAGAISRVRVYNRVITSAEVSALYTGAL